MAQTPSDIQLLEQARTGDFAAFEQLVARYERRIFALALRILNHRHDAEEVVQQTFLSLLEHLEDFRGDSAFSTWLLRIATNNALGLLRKKKVRQTTPLGEGGREDEIPFPQYIAQWKETPEEIARRKEVQQLLQEALDELDDKYRLVFLLRDVEGMSTAETAEILGISEANTKVRLLRARLMLREKLTRALGDETTRLEPHRHD
ncbi:RNA polymerase sigma factor [Thermostilla marina]